MILRFGPEYSRILTGVYPEFTRIVRILVRSYLTPFSADPISPGAGFTEVLEWAMQKILGRVLRRNLAMGLTEAGCL